MSYHEVAGDEEIPQNAIPVVTLPNYTNTSNPQTLYVRVENTETGCYVTGSFELEVREGASATPPSAPYEVCEDEQGSGVGTFDLPGELEAEILNGQDPDIYLVSYHESLEQAEVNEDPIGTPESYESETRVIWARVTNS
ncbi:hypothetical protein, partial [Planktosalinus lacus]|uniref:hypothetical protein n=1 Tax=Planktosalinus lacus TaxID=1526573 RepID=UPI00166E5428